jgi:hypothetical protein
VVLVDGWAMASRLSFFLWGSTPDVELLDAAASGELDTPEGVDAQAARLLADARAQESIASFHDQWLELHHIESVVGEDLADSMREETRLFVGAVVGEGTGTLNELLSAPYTFVDAPLADIYGVTAPDSGFVRVTLDARERGGLLTQPAVLVQEGTLRVFRGKFVRERLLCGQLPPPPDGIDFSLPRLENETCRACHTQMDLIGNGFDRFDDVGRHVETWEDGAPIEEAGEIVDVGSGIDIAGPFSNAEELRSRLAASTTVAECVADQWLTYALRREASEHDNCARWSIEERFIDSAGDIVDLMRAITTSDAFRYMAMPSATGGV